MVALKDLATKPSADGRQRHLRAGQARRMPRPRSATSDRDAAHGAAAAEPAHRRALPSQTGARHAGDRHPARLARRQTTASCSATRTVRSARPTRSALDEQRRRRGWRLRRAWLPARRRAVMRIMFACLGAAAAHRHADLDRPGARRAAGRHGHPGRGRGHRRAPGDACRGPGGDGRPSSAPSSASPSGWRPASPSPIPSPGTSLRPGHRSPSTCPTRSTLIPWLPLLPPARRGAPDRCAALRGGDPPGPRDDAAGRLRPVHRVWCGSGGPIHGGARVVSGRGRPRLRHA